MDAVKNDNKARANDDNHADETISGVSIDVDEAVGIVNGTGGLNEMDGDRRIWPGVVLPDGVSGP